MSMFFEPSDEDLFDRFLLPYEELRHDEKIMWGLPQTVGWRTVAEILSEARTRLGLSKRQAARRAGISEGTWRQLERGPTLQNNTLYVNQTRPENLYAAAQAVGVDPKVLFDLFDEKVPEGIDFTPYDDRLARKIAKLAVRDRDIVERLVDSMLENNIGDAAEGDEDL